MKRADGLGSGLPFEIVKQVLSHLSVPDLCRYRTVCKKWNRLISKREFAARCLQNAKDSEASYIVARYYRCKGTDSEPSTDFERGVSIFDLKARRWYLAPKDDEWRTDCGDLVADGGLICQYKWEPYAANCKRKSLIVYNPIAGTKKIIRATYLKKYLGYEHPMMAMTVDPVTCNYKIFLIYGIVGSMQTIFAVYSVRVYDLATKKWMNPSSRPNNCLCSVAYQDKLYILMAFDYKHELQSYTTFQDMWLETGVVFHDKCILIFPQLMVSSNHRLFLMTWPCLREEKDGEGHWHRALEHRGALAIASIGISIS